MKQPSKPFALCVDYKASLIPGKVYRLIPDARAAKDDFVRVVDESGEDYLYHKSHFVLLISRHLLRGKFWPSSVPANKQLQRTVQPGSRRTACASFHYAHAARSKGQRAAAELRLCGHDRIAG